MEHWKKILSLPGARAVEARAECLKIFQNVREENDPYAPRPAAAVPPTAAAEFVVPTIHEL
jgi:hypothetical protein